MHNKKDAINMLRYYYNNPEEKYEEIRQMRKGVKANFIKEQKLLKDNIEDFDVQGNVFFKVLYGFKDKDEVLVFENGLYKEKITDIDDWIVKYGKRGDLYEKIRVLKKYASKDTIYQRIEDSRQAFESMASSMQAIDKNGKPMDKIISKLSASDFLVKYYQGYFNDILENYNVAKVLDNNELESKLPKGIKRGRLKEFKEKINKLIGVYE